MTVENHPWLIAQELENQVWRPGMLKEENGILAPKVNARVNNLIRRIIPEDPHPTRVDRIQADMAGAEVVIKFTFGHIEEQKDPHSRPGDEIDLIIQGSYPRDEQGIPGTTIIKLGTKKLYRISDYEVIEDGKLMNKAEVESFYKYLFDGLEMGIESGEIVPVILRPRPLYGPYLDEA